MTGNRPRPAARAITALLVVMSCSGGSAMTTQTDAVAEAERLRALELVRLQALVAGDVATLEPLIGADFRLVPPPGVPMSRDEYLGALGSGAIDYHEFYPVSPIEVRFYGQAAVLTYRSYISVTVAGLGAFQTEAWHTFVSERRHGRWQVVHEQATSVGGFPPP